jgi:8-oxo-dGTP diphosphatase
MAGATAQRPLIPVAAGCLVNSRGEVLIAQRPVGKIAAGQWEFPGGKIEAGEAPYAALVRELREELGIEVTRARPLIRVTHDYTDRRVLLDTWRVDAWTGVPHGREEQALAWVVPERLDTYPLLAADRPIVAALRLPECYVFTPPRYSAPAILQGLARLPRGCLLRLRLPELEIRAYRELAQRVQAAQPGLRLVLDREPELSRELGAGWHARASVLAELSARPHGLVVALASGHDAGELERARALGFDAAVLGPVQATSTHPGVAALGFTRFGEIVGLASFPVYGIGGLAPADRDAIFAAYSQGVAGIGAFWN